MTGGSGFIGQQLIQQLTGAGSAVTTLGGNPVGDNNHIPGDLREGIRSPIPRGDLLIHLAAESGGIQAQSDSTLIESNAAMTRSAMDAARKARVQRVFLASSAVVYRDGSGSGILEDSPLVRPGDPQATPYALSKLITEATGHWFHEETEVPVIIGRLTTVYGPGGVTDPKRSSVIHGLVSRAMEQPHGGSLLVWGTGQPRRSFIHVEDAAAAIVHLIQLPHPPQVVNISGADQLSIAELATLIVRLTDHDLKLTFDSTKPDGALDRVLRPDLLIARGFRPHWTLESGLADTITWAQTTGGPDARVP